jgi:hypothetical protein
MRVVIVTAVGAVLRASSSLGSLFSSCIPVLLALGMLGMYGERVLRPLLWRGISLWVMLVARGVRECVPCCRPVRRAGVIHPA